MVLNHRKSWHPAEVDTSGIATGYSSDVDCAHVLIKHCHMSMIILLIAPFSDSTYTFSIAFYLVHKECLKANNSVYRRAHSYSESNRLPFSWTTKHIRARNQISVGHVDICSNVTYSLFWPPSSQYFRSSFAFNIKEFRFRYS